MKEEINEYYSKFREIYTKENYPEWFKFKDEHNEKDFIHTDVPHMYSMLVYLSPTNLNSGTDLYNENDEMIASFKFVQNRAVLFSSSYKHRAINNHGTDVNNGRLTLNIFMDK